MDQKTGKESEKKMSMGHVKQRKYMRKDIWKWEQIEENKRIKRWKYLRKKWKKGEKKKEIEGSKVKKLEESRIGCQK